MRDKRESTPVNAEHVREMAGVLPKVLASRIRAAREASGLSQGVVAQEMARRGFSTWRQTTVAKSEANARPVLFAEVIALANIFRRPVEYFIYAGTELDAVLDHTTNEVQEIESEIDVTQRRLRTLENDREDRLGLVGLASAIVRYRNTSDSGPLQHELEVLLGRWRGRLLRYSEVYESVGIPMSDVGKVDHEALCEVARQTLNDKRAFDGLGKRAAAALWVGINDLADGKDGTPIARRVLRDQGDRWVSLVTFELAEIIIRAVHRQAATR